MYHRPASAKEVNPLSMDQAQAQHYSARAGGAANHRFFRNPMLTARYYAPPARGAPHKPTEKFRPVPPIASTIDHTGEARLGARDQPCIRPAIGTQTPWHDSCWLQLSLGTSLRSIKGRY